MHFVSAIVAAHPQTGGVVDPSFAMNRAFADRRNTRNKPSTHAMATGGVRQLARNRAQFHSAQIRVRRRIMSRRMGAAARSHRIRDLKEQRRRSTPADKRGIAFAVKVSNPGREHVMIEDGNRPRVVEALRCAGFPKDSVALQRRAKTWPRDLAEHFEGEKGRLATNDLSRRSKTVLFRTQTT